MSSVATAARFVWTSISLVLTGSVWVLASQTMVVSSTCVTMGAEAVQDLDVRFFCGVSED